MKKIVDINTKTTPLSGVLNLPNDAHGIILVIDNGRYNSTSSNGSLIIDTLYKNHIATLLIIPPVNLSRNQFNIPLFTEQFNLVITWIKNHSKTGHLPVGLVGIGAGAATALTLCSELPMYITVATCWGRPDFAENILHKIKTPILLIADNNDSQMVKRNLHTYECLNCLKQLEIIEENGHGVNRLEKVTSLILNWSYKYLRFNFKPAQHRNIGPGTGHSCY